MVARGYSRRHLCGCGCTIRAMVSVASDGTLQALVCTDALAGRETLCIPCQRVCQRLNAMLQSRDFLQAAALDPVQLRPEEQHQDDQLQAGLAALHEALLDAILEYESKHDEAFHYGAYEDSIHGQMSLSA